MKTMTYIHNGMGKMPQMATLNLGTMTAQRPCDSIDRLRSAETTTGVQVVLVEKPEGQIADEAAHKIEHQEGVITDQTAEHTAEDIEGYHVENICQKSACTKKLVEQRPGALGQQRREKGKVSHGGITDGSRQ